MNKLTKLNIHIYPSNLTCETRIEKLAQSLIKKALFDQIIVIGTNDGEVKKLRTFADRIKFRLMGLPNKYRNFIMKVFVFLTFYISVIVFCFRKKEIKCINAHSLSVLPLCYIISKIKKTKLIYDTHELETESNSISGIRKIASKLLERLLISKVDYTFVVSKSIEDWYQTTYSIVNIETVFNAPSIDYMQIDHNDYFRSKFNISSDSIIYIYVGGLGPGRGVEVLLDAFSKVERNKASLIFMGEGPLVKKVLASQELMPVYYHEPVATSEVVSYSSSADIGISYIENTSLSHYFSMPNKVFEYLYSSLPVITSNMLDSSRFVLKHEIGFVVENGAELLALVGRMNRELIQSKKSNIGTLIKGISWEKQEDKIEKVYNGIL
jgi:glycosyltransferase involved in cell wall biosynthesis